MPIADFEPLTAVFTDALRAVSFQL